MDRIAEWVACPATARQLPLPQGWHPQSLAYGAAGVALLHIERARRGHSSWQRAHAWLECAAGGPVVAGQGSHLFYGAPALAFALHAATADHPSRYARALDTLDRHIATAIRRRLDHALARIDHGKAPALAEFDAIRGLSGLGALALRRGFDVDLTRAVLAYLVRLTDPLQALDEGGDLLPGWWSRQAPSGKPSPHFLGGHANLGLAHGVGGPLALLALAARRGVTVDGQQEAIGRICGWLDQWYQDGPDGPWWPYWITLDAHRTGRPGHGPGRPSWCYGATGLARAQQLAALATGDTARLHHAENALLRAVTAPAQRAAVTDPSLCHGWAGLAHITRRAAADAVTPGLRERLLACLPGLLAPITGTAPDPATARPSTPPGHRDIGLLEGVAGIALVLLDQDPTPSVSSGWDACFLIT